MRLTQQTKCDITFSDEDWDIGGKEYEQEMREAVETVRENHSETVWVNPDDIYTFQVKWNENTDSVWVSVFAYALGLEVDDEQQTITP